MTATGIARVVFSSLGEAIRSLLKEITLVLVALAIMYAIGFAVIGAIVAL